MPHPRPAPSSAHAGSSRRQELDEERAVTILQRLAGAADLGACVVLRSDGICLAAVASGLSSSPPAAVAAGSPGHALLAAWMAAVARGMQLAAQQPDLIRLRQHSKQVDLLSIMVETVRGCFSTLIAEDEQGADDGRERMRVALSVLALRAGMVKAHEQLSLRLASIIRWPQAAGSGAAAEAQQQMAPEVAVLAANLIDLISALARGWPGGPGGLFSPKMCQAVPATAGLAAAVLHSSEVRIRVERVNHSTWHAANSFLVALCNAYNAFGCSGRSVPAQVAGSGSVGTLLLIWLGLTTQRLHQLGRGLSPAAVRAAPSAAADGMTSAQQQRLAVPAHHTQLLQALGVAASSVHPNSLLAAQGAEYWAQALQGLLATPGQRQHLADAAAAASCQPSLLLVLLECALLDPTWELLEELSPMLHSMSARSEQTAWQLASPLLQAILEQDACRRALEAAAAPAAAAAVSDVPDGAADDLSALEVLVLLAIDVNAAAVAAAFVNAGGGEEAFEAADDEVFYSWLAGLVEVTLEHTAQYASLMEAGLRMLQIDRGPLRSALASACAVEAAARARHSAGSGAMAADSQQQVFALLLSCLKVATAVAAVAAEQGSSNSNASRADAAASKVAEQTCVSAGRVVRDAILACRWLLEPSRRSSSNQTSMAASAAAADATAGTSAQLSCVLLARCLVAAGRLLQQQTQAPASDGNPRCSSMHLYMHRFTLLVEACCSGVSLLVQQLPQQAAAAAAEPWLQQLLDEHTQLEQQLEGLQAQMPAPGATNLQPPAAAVAGVAEQLQAFGAAVCAALPVQECCNHHDCSNLEQASELELVSGKSCVCGGCGVARYCSRECQVAHYKGWHKAVCKRLQAQQQQEQQAAAAAQQQQPQVQEQQPETQQHPVR